MERREFLGAAGVIVAGVTRNAEVGTRNWAGGAVPSSAFHVPRSQVPTLGPAVFAQRISRAQAELKSRNLDLLVVEPSTNFQYFTSYNPGRSERLILLMIPATGAAVIVCPSFEVERIKRNTTVSDARGWEEQVDPARRHRCHGAAADHQEPGGNRIDPSGDCGYGSVDRRDVLPACGRHDRA